MNDRDALNRIRSIAVRDGWDYEWLHEFVKQTRNITSKRAVAVREANVLRREASAWRRWNARDLPYSAVETARAETDRAGAFHCAPTEET